MSLKAAIAFAARDVTQMHLQEVSGVNQGRLSKIFNPKRIERPSLREIVAVEDALGYERGYILALAGYASAEGAAQASAEAANRGRSSSRAGTQLRAAKGGATSGRRRGSSPRPRGAATEPGS